jgi:hypothetical protein
MSMDQVKQTMKMLRNMCQPKTGVSVGKTSPHGNTTQHNTTQHNTTQHNPTQ